MPLHFHHIRRRIKNGDTDIELVLPNDTTILLQFREEGNSLDVILPQPSPVSNWASGDMKPAPKTKLGPQHVRVADQLCIELSLGAFDMKKKDR